MFADWNKLKTTFELINMHFNTSSSGEQKYGKAVQTTIMDIHEAICAAEDMRIQLMHAAVRKDFEASEQGTISVWEAISSLKSELEKVSSLGNLNA
jgi:hypothetical protein